MRRSGLDKKLDDIIDFVYIDAPNAASGPPQADVAPFFEPPYREWWSAEEVLILTPTDHARNISKILKLFNSHMDVYTAYIFL